MARTGYAWDTRTRARPSVTSLKPANCKQFCLSRRQALVLSGDCGLCASKLPSVLVPSRRGCKVAEPQPPAVIDVAAPTTGQHLEAAREMRPRLAERAAWVAQNRRIPEDTLDSLVVPTGDYRNLGDRHGSPEYPLWTRVGNQRRVVSVDHRHCRAGYSAWSRGRSASRAMASMAAWDAVSAARQMMIR